VRRTLTTVFDDIGEWSNSYGTFYSVGALFEDGSILQANKKTRQDAQELRSILLQVLDMEADYYCDDKGLSKSGNQKWALKAILDVEGGAIYGKPPQNVGAGSVREDRLNAREAASPADSRAPVPTSSKDEDIRKAVALKAAAHARPGQPVDVILDTARLFEKYLDTSAVAAVSDAPAAAGGAHEAPLSTPPAPSGGLAGPVEGEAAGPAPRYSNKDNAWEGMDVN
jgi:hypothetical protein